MKTYKEFTNFIEAVKDNDLFTVKLELANMVIFLKGDKTKVDEAISYAQTNSEFNFETHQVIDSKIPLPTYSDQFAFEKGELLTNFSKERLDEVFRLYPLMINEQEVEKESQSDESDQTKYVSKDKVLKGVVVLGGLVLATYLIYRILK